MSYLGGLMVCVFMCVPARLGGNGLMNRAAVCVCVCVLSC